MSNWIQKGLAIINKENVFFTFLRSQFSAQLSSQIDFGVTILCVNLFGVFYGLATLLGNIAGGIVNFYLNYKWTFKSKGLYIPHILIKFILVWIGSVLLNAQGTIFFTEFIMKHILTENMPQLFINNIFLIPKIIVSLIIGVLWNYNLQRNFVYKDIKIRKYLAKIGIVGKRSNDLN